ncbi:MAG: DUF1801 domain-containing protein [Planctomycetes bacterium]|nr:DUF1801 domain-containing protein [Planctomycetota bacterium]
MQSKAKTVEAYLAELPADRREALEAVRKVILKNLDKDYEERMGYGMMGYAVPHRVYPAGYHCDPKQPLPFAGLASQKQAMSVYLMSTYMTPAEFKWFTTAWAKTGKKLDMGKSCIRFKKVEDLALEVLGEAIRRMPAKRYIAEYEKNLAKTKSGRERLAATRKMAEAAAQSNPKRDTKSDNKSGLGKSAPPSKRPSKKPAKKKEPATGRGRE